MARKRKRELSMRKMREILRLGLQCGLGIREIARSCCISHPTAKKYLEAARKAGLKYEQAAQMDDKAVYALLNRSLSSKARKLRPMPDWAYIHEELKKKSVTLQLLWQEYKAVYADGYESSQFSEYYRRWKKKLNVSLRQTYRAGEKMFVDYAGQTISIHDKFTGKVKQAQIFISVLGASNYTYAEASWDQSLGNWINGHIRTFEYFKGVTRITIPDNLKAGISRACRYEPDINPTYHDLAAHYGTVIIPARVRRPKDKSKVEAGVLVVERWILAALRNRKFFGLNELNRAIRELLVKLNERPFKKLPGSRRSLYEKLEKDALIPLPQVPYVLAEWKKARVNIDYHIELKGHYYSVPYNLVHEKVDIRFTNTTVEILYNGKRIASHIRDDSKGRHTTIKEHMPKAHRQYLEWTPSRIINWAGKIGKSTSEIVEIILNSRKHPEQAYRSCLGILRLAKAYSDERLESACRRALVYKGYSYKSIKAIIENGLDKQPLLESKRDIAIKHENIRGNKYFNNHVQQEVIVC